MKIEEIASRLATIKKSLQATDLHTLTLRVEEVENLIGAGTTKAFRILKELCEAKQLEQTGTGKLRTYVIK